MLYMVVETFRNPNLVEVRARFQTQGRLVPDGLVYVSSWMTSDGAKCFQVMDSPRRELLDEWVSNWSDLVDFEVVSVESSADFWGKRN